MFMLYRLRSLLVQYSIKKGLKTYRDRYLEQQQTEENETEVRNVDGMRIMKVYACWVAFWRVKRALQLNRHIYYSPQLAAPYL
jgi:hypothetical protein